MSGFNGTKGEWRAVESTCGLITETQCISIRVGENDFITVWDFSEESQANALLISKAPEMLEMLEKISDRLLVYSLTYEDDELGEQAKELIKSATEL